MNNAELSENLSNAANRLDELARNDGEMACALIGVDQVELKKVIAYVRERAMAVQNAPQLDAQGVKVTVRDMEDKIRRVLQGLA